MKINIKHLLIILLFSFGNLFTQNIYDQKYRLAQSYENSGDFENSIRLYKELLDAVPLSDTYFDSYIRVSKSVNKFSEIIPTALIFAEKKPLPKNLALIGELYWRVGNIDSANIFWEEALKSSKNQSDFNDILASQLPLKLFEKAINTLIQGRNKLNSEDLFSDELSRLYIAIGDYRNGIKEIITTFNLTNNFGLAQGRIYALLEVNEAEAYIKNYFNSLINKPSSDLMLLELYSSFLREIEDYEEAFNVVLKLDKIKNSGGRDILNFARVASDDGNFEIAIKSYQKIINIGKDSKFAPNAMMGLSETLEKAYLNKQDFSKEQAIEIIDSYNNVSKIYQNSSYAQQAKLRIGIIAKDKLGDLQLAIESFNQAIQLGQKSNFASEAAIYMALIHINNSELDDAKATLTKVATSRIGGNNQDYILKAKFYLGEIQFFKGEFDAALNFYNEISKIPNSSMANDALNRIMIIESNKEDFKALNYFSEASYEEYKSNIDNSIVIYQKLLTETPMSQLAEISLMRIATLNYESNKFEEARKYYQKLILEYPISIFLEEAYFKLALTYMNDDINDKAIQYFKEILIKFPNSIYLQESRKNIRKLRGEEI